MEWHEGELALQAQAGFQKGDALRRMIQSSIPAAAQEFLHVQTLAFLTTVDSDGRPRVSPLAGAAGFLRVRDDRTVEISRAGIVDPRALDDLDASQHVGLLAIEFATRKRMRLNGKATVESDGSVVVRADEVYSNCPKYIQRRELEDASSTGGDAVDSKATEAEVTDALSESQAAWIEGADTFLIGSRHPVAGADASHRGGEPGFVRKTGARRLTFPDYAGNNMFQTLGNLSVDPRAALLFVDFEEGHTLHLMGRATIVDDPERAASFPGAMRLVDVEIDEVSETKGALPGSWRLEERSPYNPTSSASE